MGEALNVSDNVYERLVAFKPLFETVTGEQTTMDAMAGQVIAHALDVMLLEVIGPVETNVALASFQQLAAVHPDVVYDYVARILREGAELQRRRAMQRIGFGPPEDEPSSSQT